MIQSLIAALILLWMAAIATSFTLDGWVHVLLGIALVVLVIDQFASRRPS